MVDKLIFSPGLSPVRPQTKTPSGRAVTIKGRLLSSRARGRDPGVYARIQFSLGDEDLLKAAEGKEVQVTVYVG